MPYDHYLFDMPDMNDALESITENGEQIVGTFYCSDTSQVCIVVRTEKVDKDKLIESIFRKKEDED